jgi:hypothetical protein
MCIALMKFRTSAFPQAGLIADQQMLEQALMSGGPNSVAAAMDILKGLDVDAYAAQNAYDVDAHITAVEDAWEWALTKWAEPPAGGPTYELREKRIGGDEATAMLSDDKTFLKYLLHAVITPTHLTSTGSTVSPDPGALNCQENLCPKIMAWLITSRKGEWGCMGLADDSCSFQHYCRGGRDCDAEGCVLLHPDDEYRWVVLQDKKQEWVEPMTLDEAISYRGEGKSEMKALAMDVPDCTNADVWRASTATLAFGRKEIPAATAAPAPMPAPEDQNTKPALDAAAPEDQNTKPALAAAAPALAAAAPAAATNPTPVTEPPAETAVVPAGGADNADLAAAAQTEGLPTGELASADRIDAKKTAQPTPAPKPRKRSRPNVQCS